MARVNYTESYEFLKNLPSRNPSTFAAIDRDKGPAIQRANFVRVIDVEENDEERKFKNDRTSLLLRSLKKNWNNMNGQQTQASRPSSSTQNSSMDIDARPSGSARRITASNDVDDFTPVTKHRKQN